MRATTGLVMRPLFGTSVLLTQAERGRSRRPWRGRAVRVEVGGSGVEREPRSWLVQKLLSVDVGAAEPRVQLVGCDVLTIRAVTAAPQLGPLSEVPGVPETALEPELLARLPQTAPPAPWDLALQALVWFGPPGRAAAPVLPIALRANARVVARGGGLVRYLETPGRQPRRGTRRRGPLAPPRGGKRRPAEGVTVRHARGCGTQERGRCRCAPAYQAQVFSRRHTCDLAPESTAISVWTRD